MRLKVHTILKGRFIQAGEEIDEAEIPAEIAMRYRAEAEEESEPPNQTRASSSSFTSDEKPKEYRKPKRPTFVLRNGEYIPLSILEGKLVSGEALYWCRPRGLGKAEKFIKFANAK